MKGFYKNTGGRRHRVLIQEAKETRTDKGSVSVQWLTVWKRWAEITAVSGSEVYAGRTLHAETSHLVVFNFVKGLTVKHRVLFGGRVLDIQAINDIEERGKFHELQCTEII